MGSHEKPVELSLEVLTSLYRAGRIPSIIQYVRASCAALDETKASIPQGQMATDVDGKLIVWNGKDWRPVFEVQ